MNNDNPNKQYNDNKLNSEMLDALNDIELNTISLQDCTGLIPSAIKDSAEIEHYEELYPYLTPPTNDKKR